MSNIISTNSDTGRAVAAFREMCQLERKLSQKKKELHDLLSYPLVDWDAYLELTKEIEEAHYEGLPIENVGRAQVR